MHQMSTYSLDRFASERSFTLAGLIIGLAILAGLGLLAYQQGSEQAQQRDLFKMNRDILLRAHELLGAIRDAENGQRGYILTRNTNYLETYKVATAAIPDRLQQLQSSLSKVQSQNTDLGPLWSLTSQKLDELHHSIELATTNPQQALGQMQIDQGKHLTEQLQQRLHSIRNQVMERVEEISERERSEARQAFHTVLGGAILAAIMLVTATLLVLRDSRAKEQAYRLMEQTELLNLAPIMTRSLDGTIAFWSQGFEHLYGWTAEQAIGHNSHNLLHTTFSLPLEEIQSLLLSHGEWSGELTQQRHDGGSIVVAATWTLVQPGKGESATVVEVHNDISLMKLSEAARVESEARLKLLANNMSQFAWMADEKGWIFWYNQRWFDYSGTTLEEMQGWGWEKVHHPDHLQRVKETWQRALETGDVWEDTFPLRGQDGQYRWFLSRAMPIRDPQAKIFRWFGTNTDITELREAEHAQARLAAIVDGSTDAVISKSLDGRIMTWNEGAENLFGYAATDVIGRPIELLIPSELQSEEWRVRAMVHAGGSVKQLESQRLHKSGRRIEVSISMSPIKDNAGRIIGASQIARDISERKQAQRLLEASERFSRALFERSPDCVTVIESNGHLLSMNAQGMCAMEIEDFDAVKGKPWAQLWSTDAHDIIQIAFDKCRNGELATFRSFSPTAKGNPRWWDVSLSSIDDGSGRMLAVSRDVTEQERIQAAVRASEARVRTLTTAIPQLVWTCTPDGYYDYLSDQWLAYTGTPLEDNLRYGWLKVVHPDDIPHVQQRWQESVETGAPFTVEYRLHGADGNYRWHLAQAHPQIGIDGVITKWFGTSTNITEQKESALLLERINQELDRRTAALAAANKELESFSYSISHDLRAPLRTMTGFAQALLEDFGDKIAPEAARYLKIIDKGARQLGQLIDDLLAFSRLSRQGIKKTAVRLDELLDEVRNDFAADIGNRPVEWVIHELPECLADRTTMKLVLANLVGNALKYSRPRDSARIEIGAEPAKDQPGLVTVYIKDNGVGFDMRYVDKLFTVFQRLHRSDDFEGTGIGLAIVQRIIHRHGGHVSGEGRIGEGATFRFTVEQA